MPIYHKCFLALIIGVLFLAGCTQKTEYKGGTKYFGVVNNTIAKNSSLLKKYKSNIGIQPHLLAWELTWDNNFPVKEAKSFLLKDVIIHIHWLPLLLDDPEGVSLSGILDGEWDSYIDSWAKQIKDYRYPVIISLAPDFNNPNNKWSFYVKNWINDKLQTAEDYKKMFRYVVNRFEQYGALNVFWCWSYQVTSVFNTEKLKITEAFPGSEIIDWIGFSYNFEYMSDAAIKSIISFNQSLANKPQMISELSGMPIAAKFAVLNENLSNLGIIYLSDRENLLLDNKNRESWHFDEIKNFFNQNFFKSDINAFNK